MHRKGKGRLDRSNDNTHPGVLHVLLQVVGDSGDDVGIETCQGQQRGGRGRSTEGVNLPGELGPDAKCLVEKPMSFCEEKTDRLDNRQTDRGSCSP